MADKKTFGKKALAVMGAAGLVVGGVAAGLTAGFVADDSDKIDALNTQVEGLQADIDAAALVEPEVVEVLVDNENLGLVLNHIYDNDGDIAYLTDELDDDDVEEIVDRIIFVNEAKNKAVAEIKKNLFDEIDDRSSQYDEDDMSRLRVDDDADEIEFRVSDWDDEEAELTVYGTFKDGSTERTFEAILEFYDGEFDEFGEIKVESSTI